MSNIDWQDTTFQLGNLIIAITIFTWLSSLSDLLGDAQYVGWGLTLFFVIIYTFAIVLILSAEENWNAYTAMQINRIAQYNSVCLLGGAVIALFTLVAHFSGNLTTLFIFDTISILISWFLLCYIVIPSLLFNIRQYPQISFDEEV